jgi:hypothetical protein
MDGVLRKLTDRTCEATLHGHRVQIFYAGGGWYTAVIDGLGHVKVGPRVASFAARAKRARAWVEGRLSESGRRAPARRGPFSPRCGG